MNPFRAIGKAWRRWRLKVTAPLCPVCGMEDPLLHEDTDPPMWHCPVCQAQWWQGRKDLMPVGYAHERRWKPETWKKVLEKPLPPLP